MAAQHEEKEPGDRHGRTIRVYYGETAFDLKPGAHEGAELAAIFSVPAGYILDVVNEDGGFDDVDPTRKIVIRDDMRFASHPPVGQSS
ncbi:hypothetical protein [Sphingomonas sp. URHD0057]|uniref:hypothetical protein n=1 Tax=Sphingomonas sp. URHD0057 TaxID=1380389 RepID=UPI000B0EC1B0|nr:hypothetical protein [Sphingomonas sp. URHD0057]